MKRSMLWLSLSTSAVLLACGSGESSHSGAEKNVAPPINSAPANTRPAPPQEYAPVGAQVEAQARADAYVQEELDSLAAQAAPLEEPAIDVRDNCISLSNQQDWAAALEACNAAMAINSDDLAVEHALQQAQAGLRR